jgi:hypothetical protein
MEQRITIIVSHFIALIFILIPNNGSSHPQKYHKRKHGSGYLSMEVVEKTVSMTIVVPTVDVLGFEETPDSSEKFKLKVIDEFRKLVTEKADQFVKFDSHLECSTKAYVLGLFVGEHDEKTEETATETSVSFTSLFSEWSLAAKKIVGFTAKPEISDELAAPKTDIVLKLKATCQKSLQANPIAFGITALMPKISRVKLHLISGKNIKARFIKRDRGTVTP